MEDETRRKGSVVLEEGGGHENEKWFEFPIQQIPSTNLTRQVSGWTDQGSPLDGDANYELFFERLVRGMHRQSPKHIVVKRERGVGDNVAMIEFARKAASGVYPHLESSQVIRVDFKYVSAEDSREVLSAVFDCLASRSDIILCIDGISSVLAPNGSGQNRQFIFSLLANCPFRIIGLVTPQEFEEHFAGRPDADEFFSYLELGEPELDVAEKLVAHFAHGLSKQYDVEIEASAIRAAVVLSSSYIPSSRLPTKAVGILRDLCDDVAFERSIGKEVGSLTEDEVTNRVSELTGVPIGTLKGLPHGVDYKKVLGDRIIGQDHVLDEVATEMGLIRAGMVDRGKPASVMLFVGQTGTGKTELAKVMAQLYSASKKLKTFTLGNYSEPHSVSGIIGVPAGYVGHDQGGRLVNELNSDPYSVFLLDEADKAHPDVMQPFLNLFDEGWIVDQRGTKGYAERAIFVLTTNVGQRQIAEMQRKGKPWDEIHTKLMESLSQIRHAKANRPVFSAEFLARIKRVVIFKPLDSDAMTGISHQLCRDLSDRWLEERQKELIIEEGVVEWVAGEAHDQNDKSKGKEGGRIVRKVIANRIESCLQSSIATAPHEYKRTKRITVSLGEDSDSASISFN